MKKILLSLAVLSLFLFTSCELTFFEDPEEGFTIYNNSWSNEIEGVYVIDYSNYSYYSYNDWGYNQLSYGEYIASGSSMQFVLEPGYYAVKVVNEWGEAYYDTYVEVHEDGFTPQYYTGSSFY